MKFQWLWEIIHDSYLYLIILWMIAAVILRWRVQKFYKHFLWISAVLYMVIFLYVTLLGRHVRPERVMAMSFLWEYRLAFQGSKEWLLQILSNICLFVPMGWLFKGLNSKAAWYKAALLGGAISLTVELCQLVFRLGLFELDDIFNNTMGMLLGYAICSFCHVLNVRIVKKRKNAV